MLVPPNVERDEHEEGGQEEHDLHDHAPKKERAQRRRRHDQTGHQRRQDELRAHNPVNLAHKPPAQRVVASVDAWEQRCLHIASKGGGLRGGGGRERVRTVGRRAAAERRRP